MAYSPLRTIVLSKGRLTESSDLTVQVSTFVGKNAFLVLKKGLTLYVIDIAKIALFEPGIVLTDAIGLAFTAKLNDEFVTRYARTGIPIQNQNKTYENRLRVFNPVSYKDYSVKFTSINTPEIEDDVTKKGFLDDLVISTKSDVLNSLVAVNGVFHRTSIHSGKIYVHDGFRTMRLSNRKDVTIVDTQKIGGHSIIGLNTNNTTMDTYNGLATIKTQTSLRNKTVFLVIDGYFYHMDADVFYYGNDTTLKVRTNKLPLIEQFRHNPRVMLHSDLLSPDAVQKSRKYTDSYEQAFLNKRSVAATTLKTKAFQLSRLTAYHSFLVVVNNPNVFYTSIDVLPTGVPQFYSDMANHVLSGMMSYSAGLCPSYLILKDPFKRKSIFLQKQDNSPDWQAQSANPGFIPFLSEDVPSTVNLPARFVDYVSA